MNSATSFSRSMNGLNDINADTVDASTINADVLSIGTLTVTNIAATNINANDIVCNTLNAATSVRTDTLLSNSGTIATSSILNLTGKVSQSTGTNNVCYGVNAMLATQTGTNNTGIGSNSLRSVTSGSFNTALGGESGTAITTGNFNTSIGFEAQTVFNGIANTSVGYQALRSFSGTNTTACGFQALRALTTGTVNSAFGSGACSLATTADAISGFGFLCLSKCNGSHNSAFGFGSDRELTTGVGNCSFGSSTGCQNASNNTQSANSCFGYNIVPSGGSFNSYFGYFANTVSPINTSYSTAIGAFATPTASNQIMLGTLSQYVQCPNYMDVAQYITTPTQPPLTNNTRVATTQYVDSAVALIGGVTLAGANVWTGTNSFNTNLPTSTLTPSSGTQLTTKTYVDTKGGLSLSNTWTGTNTFNTNLPTSTQVPSSGSDLTNKTYVDTAISNIGLYDNTLTIVDDFLCGLDNTAVRWSAVAGGAAGPFGTFAASEIDHPGIYRLASATLANGYVGLVMNTASIFTNNLTCVEWVWRYNNNYANIEIHAGYSQGINTFTTSACFRYTGTYYQAVVNGTVVYTFNKNIAIWSGSNLTNRWLYGRININANIGTQQFILSILNLNETDSYTHSAAVTSAIVTPICRIRQTGSTSATLDADYCRFKYVSPRL